MSISDGLDPYFFRRKMGKKLPMKEELDGGVFISHRSGRFLKDNMNKVLFPHFYLELACEQLGFPPRKGINRRRNESAIFNII